MVFELMALLTYVGDRLKKIAAEQATSTGKPDTLAPEELDKPEGDERTAQVTWD